MNSKQDKTKGTKFSIVQATLGLTITVCLSVLIYKQFVSENYTTLTTLLLYLWLLCFGTTLILIIVPKAVVPLVPVFGSVIITLFAADLLLHYAGLYATYTEQIGMNYRSLYSSDYNSNYCFAYPPLSNYHRLQSEYDYYRKANSMGIFEKELPLSDTAKFRILCIGDSFTEGVGVSSDSTWEKTVELHLQNFADRKIEVINGGVSGSDPVYEWMLYKQRLKAYSHQALVLMTNATDVQDLATRGGWERFGKDSTVSYRKGPGWEPFYASSRVFRLAVHSVFGLNTFLISNAELDKRLGEATRSLDALFSEIYAYCSQNNIHFLLVKQPLKREIQDSCYQYAGFGMLGSGIPDKNKLDLLQAFRLKRVIIQSNCEHYYWKEDRHFNNAGYRVCGSFIGRKLEELLHEKRYSPLSAN